MTTKWMTNEGAPDRCPVELPIFLRPTSSDPGNYKLINFDPVRHLQEYGWLARHADQGLPGRPHPLNQVNASAAPPPHNTNHTHYSLLTTHCAPHRTAHPKPETTPEVRLAQSAKRARAAVSFYFR